MAWVKEQGFHGLSRLSPLFSVSQGELQGPRLPRAVGDALKQRLGYPGSFCLARMKREHRPSSPAPASRRQSATAAGERIPEPVA